MKLKVAVQCSKCNDTTEYRNVSCEHQNGRRYPEEKCKEKRPDDTRDCASVIPCVYKWHSSQWSEVNCVAFDCTVITLFHKKTMFF